MINNKIYQIAGILLITILLLGFIGITKAEDQVDDIESSETSLETNAQENVGHLSQVEFSEQNSFLVPLEEIEYEVIQQNESTTEENIAILIPLDNLTDNETIEEINSTVINPPQEQLSPEEKNEASNTQEQENINNASTKLEEIEENEKPIEIKKIRTTLSKNEKIELEGEIPENFDINSIEKKESIIDEQRKEVIVKSEEHLEDPLTVYTDIPEVEKGQISSVEVYWVNEKKEVEINGFYDLDDNGLYDRISWVVPHLSEQVFQITINLQGTADPSQTTVKIIENYIPSGTATNPITFNFTINYTNPENVSCNLLIKNSTNANTFSKDITTTSSQVTDQAILTDGSYTWLLNCKDINNLSNYDEKQGSFTINQNYYVQQPPFYVLDWNNDIKESPDKTIDITSTNPSIKEITLLRDGVTIYGPFNTSGNVFDIKSNLTSAGNYTIRTKFYELNEPVIIEKSFTVAKVALDFSKNDIEIDEETQVTVNVNSQKSVSLIRINFGDGATNFQTNSNSKTFTHSYDDEGDYTVSADIQFTEFLGTTYTLTKNGISVSDPGDNKKPEVTLISPSNNADINSSQITFSYKTTDNVKVKNCTFELYFYENGVGILEHTDIKSNPTHETKIEVNLKDFEEGNYSWDVYCCDNSSNCNEWDDHERDFTVDFSAGTESSLTSSQDYEEKEEIEETLEFLENFQEPSANRSAETLWQSPLPW